MTLQSHHHSPSFPSCFRPCSTAEINFIAPPPPPPPQLSGKTDLATSLYNTNLGLFSLAWSRTFLGHSHLHLHPSSSYSPSSPLLLPASISFSTLHFHLHIKPFIFWKKHGYKKLSSATVPNVQVFWDLSRAKFGSGPEPYSGFYIAVVVDGEMTLLVGDSAKEAYARTRAQKPRESQALVLRRERVLGKKVYNTKARFGGKSRGISIEFKADEDGKLCFSVDNKRVLQVKRLKWKFRGNERIEVDGVSIQVSWDVYNWLFDNDLNNGHAVFMFKFENEGSDIIEGDYQQDGAEEIVGPFNEKNGAVLWQQSSCNFGVNGIEWKKMRKSLLRTARSSSSSSLSISSASSGGNSSVMEWASVEESELSAPTGFSLLVYAWKK
ncbi:hypothetical protein F3Y22_tig00001825pilonHSYRG00083 [Hibiscus syriacus]|uniref:Uncharacterized protein n=1 Tax=Hibiscus syriacus TaxID=106335 RepID=A0A6A3CZM7_HIBSY|nr:uncharacterized protein LOC120135623 isoform X1 [Hibiscus syriacus]KAE8732569.1 hypothetical protein F3Y22_tig00001825pilonHSYRG00083 [Hibiscus syriacus]